MKDQEDLESLTQFERKTFKEVTWWDWLGRLLPLTVLAIAAVCHFFEWKSALDLILEASLVVFLIVSFIWWYWAIYKIAVTVKYMRNTQQKFLDVVAELRNVKKEIKKDDSNRQR
jgi:RsiW-degrading membrane proteinase PrsW (M82 family)